MTTVNEVLVRRSDFDLKMVRAEKGGRTCRRCPTCKAYYVYQYVSGIFKCEECFTFCGQEVCVEGDLPAGVGIVVEISDPTDESGWRREVEILPSTLVPRSRGYVGHPAVFITERRKST